MTNKTDTLVNYTWYFQEKQQPGKIGNIECYGQKG
jgi:hypothetical protein